MTLKVLRPLAKSFGIKGGKIERFTERACPPLSSLQSRHFADRIRGLCYLLHGLDEYIRHRKYRFCSKLFSWLTGSDHHARSAYVVYVHAPHLFLGL